VLVTTQSFTGNKSFASNKFIIITAVFSFLAQLIMTCIPIFRPIEYPENSELFYRPPWLVLARLEQWDWEPLRALAHSKDLSEPAIAFLGAAREYNWPAITYPWALHQEGLKEVRWIWNSQAEEIDWEETMKSISDDDMIVTIPQFVTNSREFDADNQYNSELVKRLEDDPRFYGPVILKMGRFDPTDVFVFISQNGLNSQ
jgi:hypothetical protein